MASLYTLLAIGFWLSGFLVGAGFVVVVSWSKKTKYKPVDGTEPWIKKCGTQSKTN